MADYRREIPKVQAKNLVDKYKNHRDADGGIFTPNKRRKLLGVKPESSRNYKEDTADFWYDVRNTVKSGLKDLELICEVAHPKQIREIFEEKLSKEENEELGKISKPEDSFLFQQRLPSLERFLTALFTDYKRYKQVPFVNVNNVVTSYSVAESIEKDYLWRAVLAKDIIQIGLNFFKEHNLVTSKAHRRLVEEIEDMLTVELARVNTPQK